MKRRITSLAMLVLSLLMAAPVLADELSLIERGDLVTTPEAEQFYVIQGNGQANQVTWLFDNDGALSATTASDVPTGLDGMKYIWTFEFSDDGVAAKNYTTGRYIFIEGTSNGGSVKMREEPFYFTIEANGDFVAFKNASGQYIDMQYNGNSPATWGGGVSGSRRMNIYNATVESLDDLTLAKQRLNDCFGTYDKYLPDYGSTPINEMYGTEVGQYNYSEDDYNTFVDNMLLAEAILSEEITSMTSEDIYEIIENIETSIANILASIVKLTIANGNYRIVSALEWTNTERIATGEVDENDQPVYEEVVTHPTKAMYATLEGKAMWANIDSTDCRYLWSMTNNAETGLIKMMNIATDGILATCSQSTPATLDKDSKTEMTFEFIRRTEDDKIVVVMKPSTGGGHAFLHCNGHGNGTGNASSIVGWTAEAGASQWILEPVSDEEVAELIDAYAPIKDHELLVGMFEDLIAEAEAAIAQAKDDQYITERSNGLITSTDQFSSPFTDPSEGSFANVLNDEASSYWHSTWQEGDKQNHDHYFQVSFNEPISGNIQCFMRRRNVASDHITNLGVFGTNDDSVLDATTEDGWTNLGSYDLSANASSSQTVYSNIVDYGEGYKYIRFYIDGTTTGRGYGHFATFQLYKLTIDGNTQWSQMGDAATAIDSALVKAKAVDTDEMSDMTEYNELKDALDAFKAILADPSALAAAINANKDIANLVVTGDAPGFWSEGSQSSTLATTIQEATAYLKSGAYTQEQLDAYAEAITSGVTDIMAAANPVEEGKWYAIKFDSEANYNAHQWNKAGAVNTALGDLYDNYAAPANIETEGEGESQVSTLQGFSSLEEVTVGQAVRFISDESIEQMDQIAFRFVAQGDSAFVIQHKSGLYLSGAARSTNLTLGLTPALFNVKAAGYGKVVIEARNLKGERYYADAPVYLHAQNAGHSLVTWNNDAVGSSSALYIEPIDESEFDEGEGIAESVIMNAKPNSIIFMCYPTAFSVENAEIYAYQGAITEGEQAHYAFNQIEQAEAGQPVLLVVGDYEQFEADSEDEEPEEINITPLGSSFAKEPLTTGGVHGTYAYEWVDEGTVVVGGGKIGQAGNTLVLAEGKENTDCTRDISANTGYIVYRENILKDASVEEFDMVITTGRPVVKGDLNNDGNANFTDATSVLTVMGTGEYNAEADVNNDGVVNFTDYISILTIMAQQ